MRNRVLYRDGAARTHRQRRNTDRETGARFICFAFSSGILMRVTTRLTRLLVVLGLAAAVTGCNKEPSFAESPPLEVVVGQPLSETIADWDIYTVTVDPRDSVQ